MNDLTPGLRGKFGDQFLFRKTTIALWRFGPSGLEYIPSVVGPVEHGIVMQDDPGTFEDGKLTIDGQVVDELADDQHSENRRARMPFSMALLGNLPMVIPSVSLRTYLRRT